MVLAVQMERVRALSEQLVAGDAALPAWRATMAEALKAAHLEGAAVARGGWAQLSDADFQWVGQRVRAEIGYLQQFEDGLASGLIPLDGNVAARAEMYVEQGRATQREMERRMAIGRGVTQERNVLGGSSRPCGECPSLSSLGWVPAGTLPAVGARQCLSRCRCHLNFRP